MSVQNREQIYAALFSFLQKALTGSPTPAVTVTRRVKHFEDVDTLQMPYVGQLQKSEQHARKRGLDDKATLEASFLVYTAVSQDGVTPASTPLNNILDTISAALANGPVDNNQNLGLPGVVEHAWIEGKVEIYEGILLDKSIAIVPIKILTTG